MTTRRHLLPLLVLLVVGFVGNPVLAASPADQILDATGVTGGLVVHLGCGDGKLTAGLHAGDAYLVHGLDVDAKNVQAAREHIRSQGLYGPVAVDAFSGKSLPYIDNLVNLVVAENLGDVPIDEVLRVLCPGGVAYVQQNGRWTSSVKPRPAEIDDWTHYLYNARGNAVSQDMVVGPPRHFQWIGSPRWARHHDRRASASAMVSAGGRTFTIFDEGSTASILLPPKTKLIARDAFNGVILWKRDISEWFTHLWPFKSGPMQLQRRLVAVGDTVYVTLGVNAPLLALDAVTGKTIREYEGTFATEEVLFDDGVLYLIVNPTPQSYDEFKPQEVNLGAERDRVMVEFPWDEEPRQVMAIEADSGRVLWKQKYPVAPLALAVDQKRVVFHDGDKLVGLDRADGRQLWASDPIERQKKIPANITPTLVLHDGVVLFYDATPKRTLYGVSASTGKILWTGPQPKSGHYCPEDVLVAGGLVWGGEISGGNDSGEFVGRDPKTGEVKCRFLPDIDIYFMHQRCYRSKATQRWLIPGWTGTEFVDFRKQHWITNHWVRSGCIHGVMPCNGLLYTTPHSCACYMQAKLYGFCALAPAREEGQKERGSEGEARLVRGPAYGKEIPLLPQAGAIWDTYRGNASRSGATFDLVPAKLATAWRAELGGRLSSPVLANGRLIVAEVDAHTVHALDPIRGTCLWSYTAGGRVDSPPTIDLGRVIFGSADGYVYCLRASDGELIWRFRAAPEDRRMTSFEQVESVWPVSGSVLVQDGVVYCIAGRSMFVDGGLRLVKLDADTGNLISEIVLNEKDPASGENLQKYVEVRNMPVGLPDVLSSDGKHLFMRSQVMDLDGNRAEQSLVQAKGSDVARAAVQKGPEAHLFSPTGFLDDTWWHRSYWVYGRSFAEGAGGWPQAGKVAPGGRILAVDDSTVYGFGRKPVYYQWRTPMEYHLFASPKVPEIVRDPIGPVIGKGKNNQPRRRMVQHPEYRWSRSIPMLVRAMVKAGDTLFIAGPPDIVDEEEVFRDVNDTELNKKLAAQDAAMLGAKGSMLWAVSAEDGETLAELKLDSLPQFDGLIAARRRLYMVSTAGEVICFAGEK